MNISNSAQVIILLLKLSDIDITLDFNDNQTYLPAANGVAKVMLSYVSVCPQQGGGGLGGCTVRSNASWVMVTWDIRLQPPSTHETSLYMDSLWPCPSPNTSPHCTGTHSPGPPTDMRPPSPPWPPDKCPHCTVTTLPSPTLLQT